MFCVCAQLYLSLCSPMYSRLTGPPVHGISQARILEWVAISSSRVSSHPRDPARVPFILCVDRQIPYHCTILKSMKNLDSILKSRDIILLTKVHIVFPIVMYIYMSVGS